MSSRTPPALIRYGAAVICVTAALGLKLLLIPLVTQDAPYLLFFVSIMTAAWIGGLGPGLLATALAFVANQYFFLRPFQSLALDTPRQIFSLALFAIEGILVSLLSARLQTARRRAEENAGEMRELEGRILSVSDAEQHRIGNDLHDDLGQHLTGIALRTRRLQLRLAAAQSPDADEASQISDLATTAVEWTHDLVRSLSSPLLEREGLVEALRELTAHAESMFKIQCTLDYDRKAVLRDAAAGGHFYRIAQEAISNAVKHGHARNVTVALSQDADQFVMSIADDGKGFSQMREPPNGMGLQIMRYRAKMIGATVEIGPRAGGGTSVACRYHLAAEPSSGKENNDRS